MITGMHVRHDWQNWIDDHSQKTVKSLCGRRTRAHLAGIPGMTKQDISVNTKSGYKLGWCRICMAVLPEQIDRWRKEQYEYTSPIVIPCYVSAALVVNGHSEIAPKTRYGRFFKLDPIGEKWLDN